MRDSKALKARVKKKRPTGRNSRSGKTLAQKAPRSAPQSLSTTPTRIATVTGTVMRPDDRERQRRIIYLYRMGVSTADIAVAEDLTRGRINQLLRRSGTAMRVEGNHVSRRMENGRYVSPSANGKHPGTAAGGHS